MKKRSINICGFNVEVYDFGYASYMYPEFNGNAEFEISRKGFKELSHYLRTIIWMNNLINK